MQASRLPALLALVVTLVVAPVPWRVSAHANEHHGHMWLPDAHAWEHLAGDHDDHHHGDADHGHHGACLGEHDSTCPECPEPQHCHCSDEPLPTGVLVVVVAPAAHLAVGRAHAHSLSLASRGAPEVAPSDPGGCRKACEEDPIVLLR